MKKIFVLFLAILIMAIFSVSVFADGHITCGAEQSGKVQLGADGNCTDEFGLSMNVTAGYCSDGDSYAAATYNSKGTKTYGTASDTTNIYYKTGDQTDGWDKDDASAAQFDTDDWKKIGE